MVKIHKTVIILGLVSFMTDLSSEMIYPLLPVFLTGVLGAGAVALGMVEGVAESISALLKWVSGWWTDRAGKRKPFLVAGYGLAGLARPLIGLAWVWPVVLVLRFLDRIGKGLRSSPRDALIADATPAAMRGAAFGFHRAMDHAGSVLGPLAAAALLSWFNFPLRWVFFAAVVPATMVMILLVFGIKEGTPPPRPLKSEPIRYGWREMGRAYRWFLTSLAVFTLGNATDAFLLLALTQAGLSPQGLAVLWALHHVVKMPVVYLAGRFSDRMGRHAPILIGWVFHALVYAAFAVVKEPAALIAVFLGYGLSSGLTEPVEKALVADIAPSRARGSAFGYYHLVVSLTALPASALFGFLWYWTGMATAFGFGAALALLATAIFAAKVGTDWRRGT